MVADRSSFQMPSKRYLRHHFVFVMMLLAAVVIAPVSAQHWIVPDRIGDHTMGDSFSITGKTNLDEGAELIVTIVSASFKPSDKSQSAQYSGISGTIAVQKGSPDNTFSFEVATSGWKIGDYLFTVESTTPPVTGTGSFKVMAQGPTGILSVTSTPSGGTVILDGASRGTTPLNLPKVSSGLHSLTVSMIGYYDFTRKVMVSTGKTTEVNALFEAMPKLSVAFSPIAGSPEPGRSTTITLRITQSSGTAAAGARVTLTCTEGAGLATSSGTADGNGTFQTTFIAPAAGSYTVTATAAMEGFGPGSGELPIKVGAAPFPWLLLVALILALIVAAVLAYLWTRTNLQLSLKQRRIPADGTSTLPVRVQFTNGLRMLKRQPMELTVALEATSGSIKPLVISRGNAYADTPLTASRECGKVIVTARYEKQRVEERAEFTCEGGSLEITPTPREIPADGQSAATLVIRAKDTAGNYLSFLDEKTVHLATTLGSIAGTVTLHQKSPDAKATLTSGKASGTAVVTATLDALKGEGKVRFGTLEKRFCMHCGTPMALDAPKCPACGKIPPSGVDTKTCPACGEVLPMAAEYCDRCGAKQGK